MSVEMVHTKLEDYLIESDNHTSNGGWQKVFKFDNGYGASLVNHSFSYGNEMAVIKFNKDGDWELCYSTNITDDVLGNLSINEINESLEKIRKLEVK